MKNMQRLFALLLAVVMVLSMAATVFAEETAPNTPPSITSGAAHIIINGARAGTFYDAYRILDVQIANKTGEPVYLLRTGTPWETFVKNSTDLFTVTADGVYLKSTTLTDADLQEFADEVLAYAKPTETDQVAADISVPITVSGTHTSVAPRPYGFYVMFSFYLNEENQRVYSEKANVFTLPYRNTEAGTYGDLTISEKNAAVHAITKEVKEDSLADPGNSEVGWEANNAAEIEQPIEFRINVDLAPGTEVYTIHDSMPNFENIKDLKVFYSGGGQLTLNDEYTVAITNNTEDQNGFVITLSDNFRKYVTDADYLTILYNATLKPNANINETGNVNTAVLKHGTATVGTASTTTYTCKAIIKKVDETAQKNALANATFQITNAAGTVLKFTDMGGNVFVIDPEGAVQDITTDATGTFHICGLDTHDVYYLVETVPPAGYVKMEKAEIKITPTAITPESLVKEIEVVNLPGVDMPTTGGMGTTIFYAVGGILVLAAVILLITKKRMAE